MGRSFTRRIVVDRCWSLVGSTNLDPLSLHRNSELNVEIQGSAFGEQLAEVFLRDVGLATSFHARRLAAAPAATSLVDSACDTRQVVTMSEACCLLFDRPS
ncbi:MAG: phospholipase D-like domain-containing protein [Gemmatimonadales bacterium]